MIPLNVPRTIAGYDPINADGIKRARPDHPRITTSLAGLARPRPDGTDLIGAGTHATAGRDTDPTVSVEYTLATFNDFPTWNDEIPVFAPIMVQVNSPDVMETAEDAKRVRGVTMPVWHAILHKMTLQHPDTMMPEDVAKQWFFPGVNATTHPALQGAKRIERTIEVNVDADTYIRNLWGSQVCFGKYLWFVLVQEPVNDRTTYVTGVTGSLPITPGTKRADGKGVIKYVTRARPVVSSSATALDSLDDYFYETEYCKKCRGIPILVARVIKGPGQPGLYVGKNSQSTAMINMAHLAQLPTLEISLMGASMTYQCAF